MSEEEKESPNLDSAQPGFPSSEADLQTDETEVEGGLKQKEKGFNELYDRYLRIVADFENYKKRVAKEQSEFSKFASEKLLRELLPVMDNLDRAIVHSKETEDAAKLIEGVDLVRKQFLGVLSKFGVSVLESVGQPFDPHRHQAVGQLETDDEENRVLKEAQRGYFLHDRLLRPAMVVVSKRQNADSERASEYRGEKNPKEFEGGGRKDQNG